MNTEEGRPGQGAANANGDVDHNTVEPAADTPRASGARLAAERPRLAHEMTSRALHLAEQGHHVFPVDHPWWPQCQGAHSAEKPCDDKRGKHPVVSWTRAATSDPEAIRRMFRDGPYNIGIACGPSGLLVVDEDGPNGLAAYAAENGVEVPLTRQVRTGRGRHFWFRHSHAEDPHGNGEGLLADFDVNIRGAGGYVVGPGSLHVDGDTYEFLDVDVPLAPDPAWLTTALSARRGPSRLAQRPTPRPGRSGPIAEGHRHTTLVSYAGRLRESGLRIDEVEPSYLERFKDCVQPPDTTPGARYVDPECGHPFTEEEALVILHDVYTRYDGPATPGNTGEDWEASTPTPLTAKRSCPDFPVEALPPPVSRMVSAVAVFTQTDPAMAGSTSLAMLAAAAGGRAQVEVRAGWREPMNLYLATVAAPGERKSAVQSFMSAPLQDVEQELVDQVRDERNGAVATKDVAEMAAGAARKKAGQAPPGERDAALAEAIAALQAAEALEVPALPRLLADDVTSERLAGLLAEQDGRLAVVSAEGGIFETIAGRYTRGVPFLDVWLKGHSGDPIRVDRQSRGPQMVQNPALTLCLMIQPTVLESIARNPDFRGRGLLARFLYAVPVSRVGSREISPPPVLDDVRAEYNDLLRRLMLTLAPWKDDPAILTLAESASAVLVDFAETIERQLGPHCELQPIADWGGKLVGAMIRIAGLLHMAEHPVDGWRHPIEASTAERAVTLASYFRAQALVAFDRMRADPAVADAEYLLEVVRRLSAADVSRRELHVASSRSRFPKAADLDPPIRLLEDHGYLRRLPGPPREGPGRPASPRWQVHPSQSPNAE